MEQEVLFDISTQGLGIPYGLVLVVVGFVIVDVLLKRIAGTAQKRHITLFTGLACAAVLAITIFLIANRRHYKKELSEHRCSIVEGVVTDFHPMPYWGHSHESFVIKGIRFEYSDNIITPAFNNTSSHGGPIKPGMHLRVFYTDSREYRGTRAILRIERLPNQAL